MKPNKQPDNRPAGDVVLDRVCFGYTEEAPALFEGLCMHVRAGEMAALVGEAGCGKSTLLQMICGLHVPRSGLIRVGGWCADPRPGAGPRIGFVPREPMLFGGSVFTNLRLANPDADVERMMQACRLANLHLTLGAHPDGYHADIGEGGALLDLVERQCVGIARALLKRPDVLILDDSFAGLRAGGRKRLLDTINGLKGMLTLIVTARRVPAGLDLDTVFRLRAEQAVRLSVVPRRDDAGRSVSRWHGPHTGRAGGGIQ